MIGCNYQNLTFSVWAMPVKREFLLDVFFSFELMKGFKNWRMGYEFSCIVGRYTVRCIS